MKLWIILLVFFAAYLLFCAVTYILLKRAIKRKMYGDFNQTVSYDIVDIKKMAKEEIERMHDETLSPKEWELASENYKKLVKMYIPFQNQLQKDSGTHLQ